MDAVTRKVMEMYDSFPYPSAETGRKELTELATLLRLLCLESGLALSGKRILDAGTGTGHRLAHAARIYPESHFTAIDLCETSLAVARSVAAREGVRNVTHASANLLEDLGGLGRFDLVLCIGVLHHLSSPEVGLRNLVNVVAPGSPVTNPGFDVTPARLVTGIITERGIAAASREGLLALYPERAEAAR